VSPTATSRATSSPDSSANLPTTDETLTYSSRSGVVLTLGGRTCSATIFSLRCLFVRRAATCPLATRILSPPAAGESSGFPVYPGFGLSCAHFWSPWRLQCQWAQRGRSPGFTLVVPLYVGVGWRAGTAAATQSRCCLVRSPPVCWDTGPDRLGLCFLPDDESGRKRRPRRRREVGRPDSFCRRLDAGDAFGLALAEPRAFQASEDRGCGTLTRRSSETGEAPVRFFSTSYGNPPPVPCNVAADDSGRPASDPGRRVKGYAMNFPKRNFMTVP
jgi:hypothetical protein